ncbi:MAG: hypothetical protein ILA34_01850 [Bacteroidaceae bacterium]|nr:hypothetical protein [Bacteroidaceae bacterium]
MLSAADDRKFSETSEVTPVTSHPFYHIECDSKNNVLYVKYPSQLITDGYVPYLLRYSKKRPRYRPAEMRTRRTKRAR